MHQKCRSKTHVVQMSLWSQTSQLPGPYNYTWRCPSASRQSQKFFVKTEIPLIRKSTPKVYRIPKLLPQLHLETLWTSISVLQASQRNLQILHTHEFGRCHQSEQTSWKLMPISPETTSQRQTTSSHVWCKLYSSRICYYDRRWP